MGNKKLKADSKVGTHKKRYYNSFHVRKRSSRNMVNEKLYSTVDGALPKSTSFRSSRRRSSLYFDTMKLDEEEETKAPQLTGAERQSTRASLDTSLGSFEQKTTEDSVDLSHADLKHSPSATVSLQPYSPENRKMRSTASSEYTTPPSVHDEEPSVVWLRR